MIALCAATWTRWPRRKRLRGSHLPVLTTIGEQRIDLDEKITDDYFGEQERTLTAKIEAIERDHTEAMADRKNKSILADAFEQAAALIRSPEFSLDAVWDNASQAERRVLVEELIEAVTIHADRLEVTVAGAPPLIVQPGEVGLRDPGTGPLVSKMGLEPTRPLIGH